MPPAAPAEGFSPAEGLYATNLDHSLLFEIAICVVRIADSALHVKLDDWILHVVVG